LRIAPHILSKFINRILNTARAERDQGEEKLSKSSIREAQVLINRMIYLGASDALDKIYTLYDVDLLEHAELLAEHDMWYEKFRDNQILKTVSVEREKRKKRIEERRRKDPNLWKGEEPDDVVS
jgi:nitroreductase